MGDDNYHKLYYQKNKTHIKQLVKERYQKKKDEINKKIRCEVCNRVIIARMYKKHCLTNIHNNPPQEPIVNYNCNDGWIHFK